MRSTYSNISELVQESHHNLSAFKGKLLEECNGSRWDERFDDDEYYIYDDPKFQTVLFFLYTLVFCFCFFGTEIMSSGRMLKSIDESVNAELSLWNCVVLHMLAALQGYYVIIPGNLTVVLVMRLHWRMRSVTKFCLGNLAFANLCVAMFCIYQNLSLYLMDSWIFGDVLCKMYHFTNSLSHTASILILVVISVERYFAILHPFRCRRVLTIQRLRIIILGVWTISALLCSPRLYYIVTIENQFPGLKGEAKKYEVICSIGLSLFDSKIADLIHFLLLFLLPLLVITTLYAKIAYFLHKRPFSTSFHLDRTNPDNTLPTQSDHSSSGESSTTNTTSRNRFLEKKPWNAFHSKKSGSKDQTLKAVLSRKATTDVQETDLSRTKCTCDFQNGGTILGPEINLDQHTKTIIIGKNPKDGSMGLDMGKSPRRFFRVRFPRTYSQRGSLGVLCHQNSSMRSASRHRGVVRMLILIVVTFAICNLPFHLRKLYQHFLYKPQHESVWTDLSTPVTFLLMYANCAINPFLYAFMSRNFRYCVSDLIKCRLRRPTFL